MTAPYRYFKVGCDLEAAQVFRTKTRRDLRLSILSRVDRLCAGLAPAVDDYEQTASHLAAVVWAGGDGVNLPMAIPFKPPIGDPRFRVAVMVKEVDKQAFKTKR